MRVVIIGAGMTGLVAARELTKAGNDVTVIDKGRAVGGRMASKRFAGARFDHGAQHFSVRTDEFAEFVRELSFSGVIGEWYMGESVTTDRGVEPRHRGVPAMRSICEDLAVGLDVRLDTTATQVRSGIVELASGEAEPADVVVVTAPVPQASALLGELVDQVSASLLDQIAYEPCIAVMAVLRDSVNLEQGHLVPENSPIAWIADNLEKGVSDIPAATIHSTPDYARLRLEDDGATWISELSSEFENLTDGVISQAIAHRWRYSRPTNPLDVGCIDIGSGVWLAGEAFSGAKVEGAFTSGRAVARSILDGQ